MAEPDHAQIDSLASQIRLANFIRQEKNSVIAEWIDFAKSRIPSGEHMTRLALQDHIVEILNFVADDIESSQTSAEQVEKSKGNGVAEGPMSRSAAEVHAALRLNGGFNIDQMVSEYRALRASVTKQWVAKKRSIAETDINDLTRFNEAIDQAIAELVTAWPRSGSLELPSRPRMAAEPIPHAISSASSFANFSQRARMRSQ